MPSGFGLAGCLMNAADGLFEISWCEAIISPTLHAIETGARLAQASSLGMMTHRHWGSRPGVSAGQASSLEAFTWTSGVEFVNSKARDSLAWSRALTERLTEGSSQTTVQSELKIAFPRNFLGLQPQGPISRIRLLMKFS